MYSYLHTHAQFHTHTFLLKQKHTQAIFFSDVDVCTGLAVALLSLEIDFPYEGRPTAVFSEQFTTSLSLPYLNCLPSPAAPVAWKVWAANHGFLELSHQWQLSGHLGIHAAAVACLAERCPISRNTEA